MIEIEILEYKLNEEESYLEVHDPESSDIYLDVKKARVNTGGLQKFHQLKERGMGISFRFSGDIELDVGEEKVKTRMKGYGEGIIKNIEMISDDEAEITFEHAWAHREL